MYFLNIVPVPVRYIDGQTINIQGENQLEAWDELKQEGR